MALCVSFVQSRHHTAAWARCVRRARAGDILCTVHRDAINGVMMGILHHSEPYHVNKEQIEEARIEAGARRLAFESVITAFNVPTGHTIRPGRRRLRKIRARRKQKWEARRARDAGDSGGEEDATAAPSREAHADRRSAP
jgi:hypothetical protein